MVLPSTAFIQINQGKEYQKTNEMQSSLLSTPPHSKLRKIQRLFKDLHRNSGTFRGLPQKFQALFKTVPTVN